MTQKSRRRKAAQRDRRLGSQNDIQKKDLVAPAAEEQNEENKKQERP